MKKIALSLALATVVMVLWSPISDAHCHRGGYGGVTYYPSSYGGSVQNYSNNGAYGTPLGPSNVLNNGYGATTQTYYQTPGYSNYTGTQVYYGNGNQGYYSNTGYYSPNGYGVPTTVITAPSNQNSGVYYINNRGVLTPVGQ